MNARFSERLCAGPVLPSSQPLQGQGPGHSPTLEGAMGLCGASAVRVSNHRKGPAGAGTDRLALSPGVQRQRVGVRAGGEVQKHTRRAGPGQGRERVLRSLALAAESGGAGNTPIHLSFGQSLSSGMLGQRYKPCHNPYHCPAYTDK